MTNNPTTWADNNWYQFFNEKLEEQDRSNLRDFIKQLLLKEREGMVEKLKALKWEHTARTNEDKVRHHNLGIDKAITAITSPVEEV